MTVDTQKLSDQATDAVAEAIGDAYDCTRVWSAWGYGTMSSDDFCLVIDDESRLAEITQAALNPAINVIEAQAAEVERLRMALTELANAVGGLSPGDEPDVYADYDELHRLLSQARAALSGENK